MNKKILSVFMLSFLLLCGCRNSAPAPESDATDVPSVADVRKVGKLVLAEMAVTKTGTIEDLKYSDATTLRQKGQAVLNSLKIGDRKGAYSYDTYLRAYIDLSQLPENALSVDTAAHTAALRLPKIVTETAGRDPQLREEHYRVTGLRSDISAAERAQLKEEMNTMLRTEIEKNPRFSQALTEKGRQKITSYLTGLFSDYGYTLNVTFE